MPVDNFSVFYILKDEDKNGYPYPVRYGVYGGRDIEGVMIP